MHEATRRGLLEYGTRYGLVGSAVLFAALVGLRALHPLLTVRGFLFFATLGCFVAGAVPFLLVDHTVAELAPGGQGRMREGVGEPVEVTTDGQLRYKVGFALGGAGVLSLASFLAFGAL